MVTGGIRMLDWTIVIAYLVAIIGVGFAFSRRNKSSEVYFKGGRQPAVVGDGVLHLRRYVLAAHVSCDPGARLCD